MIASHRGTNRRQARQASPRQSLGVAEVVEAEQRSARNDMKYITRLQEPQGHQREIGAGGTEHVV
jgi:hypothetical protein